MRLDKYLKTARILKRREAAKELALQKRNLSETISLLVSAFAQRFEDTGSNINDGEIIQRNNHFLLHP